MVNTEMERTKQISSKQLREGYYIDLECCMCWHSESIGANTKKELLARIKEAGWANLNSDEYMLVGYHCGCNYQKNGGKSDY